MNYLITGGSGFLGQALTQHIITNGNKVTWASRNSTKQHVQEVDVITYDQLKTCKTEFEVIINLAGAQIIGKRWSESRKKALKNSRLMPTQAVLDYIAQATTKPQLLISSSAIGWYGIRDKEHATEQTKVDSDEFQHILCDEWEKCANTAHDLGVNTTIVRTGVVLSPNGGMLKNLKLPFLLGLGGKLGNGQQMFSWISLQDWVRAVLFIIESNSNGQQISPIYNLTSPQPLTNTQFTKALGNWLKRPTIFSQPRFVLETLLGEMSDLLCEGRHVIPQALLDEGFEFSHNTICEALE